MKASLSALESMFNVLLDMSRMDAGAVTAHHRPFAIDTMLHRLAAEFAPLAMEKGLRLSVRISPSPSSSPDHATLHAASDPMLVERILLNLLGNALKYTRSGGVLLSARLRSARDGPGAGHHAGSRGQGRHWRIDIWDSGVGIAAADQGRVFEEFYQVGNPQRDRAAGLGLGLSIVRRLCDLLGLHLEMRSRLGRGTRFTLRVPSTTEALPDDAHTAMARGPIDSLGVGVVEDDPEVRDGMQRLLGHWGCRVYAGADAHEVLAQEGAAANLRAIVADFAERRACAPPVPPPP